MSSHCLNGGQSNHAQSPRVEAYSYSIIDSVTFSVGPLSIFGPENPWRIPQGSLKDPAIGEWYWNDGIQWLSCFNWLNGALIGDNWIGLFECVGVSVCKPRRFIGAINPSTKMDVHLPPERIGRASATISPAWPNNQDGQRSRPELTFPTLHSLVRVTRTSASITRKRPI